MRLIVVAGDETMTVMFTRSTSMSAESLVNPDADDQERVGHIEDPSPELKSARQPGGIDLDEVADDR